MHLKYLRAMTRETYPANQEAHHWCRKIGGSCILLQETPGKKNKEKKKEERENFGCGTRRATVLAKPAAQHAAGQPLQAGSVAPVLQRPRVTALCHTTTAAEREKENIFAMLMELKIHSVFPQRAHGRSFAS